MSVPQVGDWVIVIHDYIGRKIWRELGVIEKYAIMGPSEVCPGIRLCDGFLIWGDECIWRHWNVKLATDQWDTAYIF